MRDFYTEFLLMMWMIFGYPISSDHDTSHCEWGIVHAVEGLGWTWNRRLCLYFSAS